MKNWNKWKSTLAAAGALFAAETGGKASAQEAAPPTPETPIVGLSNANFEDTQNPNAPLQTVESTDLREDTLDSHQLPIAPLTRSHTGFASHVQHSPIVAAFTENLSHHDVVGADLSESMHISAASDVSEGEKGGHDVPGVRFRIRRKH